MTIKGFEKHNPYDRYKHETWYQRPEVQSAIESGKLTPHELEQLRDAADSNNDPSGPDRFQEKLVELVNNGEHVAFQQDDQRAQLAGALDQKISELEELAQSHPEQAEQLEAQISELEDAWYEINADGALGTGEKEDFNALLDEPPPEAPMDEPAGDEAMPTEIRNVQVNAQAAPVEEGDNLWSLSEAHLQEQYRAAGIDREPTNAEIAAYQQQVIAANPRMDPDVIHPGETVNLPSTSLDLSEPVMRAEPPVELPPPGPNGPRPVPV